MTIWQMNYSVGSFICFWINYACSKNRESLGEWDWKLVVIFQMLVPAMVCVALPFIPESPRWHVQKNGNVEAARLSGINVARTLMIVYGIAGMCAGIAGCIQVGRLGAASPMVGADIPLNAAAAVLLGGTSFLGGVGGVSDTAVGVLFIGTLQNGLAIAGVQSFWQQVVTGVILIVAIAIDRVQQQGIKLFSRKSEAGPPVDAPAGRKPPAGLLPNCAIAITPGLGEANGPAWPQFRRARRGWSNRVGAPTSGGCRIPGSCRSASFPVTPCSMARSSRRRSPSVQRSSASRPRR